MSIKKMWNCATAAEIVLELSIQRLQMMIMCDGRMARDVMISSQQFTR
jgi:hypothetical protein